MLLTFIIVIISLIIQWIFFFLSSIDSGDDEDTVINKFKIQSLDENKPDFNISFFFFTVVTDALPMICFQISLMLSYYHSIERLGSSECFQHLSSNTRKSTMNEYFANHLTRNH